MYDLLFYVPIPVQLLYISKWGPWTICWLFWRTKDMMTSSNGNISRVNGPLCGEFPTQRPVTRSFDVFFDLCVNKRLNKQSWGWWFETLSRPFWRHRNDIYNYGLDEHQEQWDSSKITLRRVRWDLIDHMATAVKVVRKGNFRSYWYHLMIVAFLNQYNRVTSHESKRLSRHR